MDIDGTFRQSSGTITIDGNSGTASTSVASGTEHVWIGVNNNTLCSGGNILVVDPPHSSYAVSSTTSLAISSNSTSTNNFTDTHSFQFGDGSSSTSGNNDGFLINTAYNSSPAYINNVIINSGNASSGRWVQPKSATIQGTLTINPACELRHTLSQFCFIREWQYY